MCAARLLALLAGITAAGSVCAQDATTAPEAPATPAQATAADLVAQPGDDNVILVPSPILTLDWERLYDRSLWGARVTAEASAASSSLATENARIAEGLVAEEKSLTERRASMTPEDFRTEADAFDRRVVGIRAAQEAKARDLARRRDDERQAFIEAAFPLLDDVLRARGAVAILDRRVIIRGAKEIDVTEDLGSRVDAALGDGSQVLPKVRDDNAPQPPGDSAPQPPGDNAPQTPGDSAPQTPDEAPVPQPEGGGN